MRRIVSIVLCIVIILPPLTACTAPGSKDDANPNETSQNEQIDSLAVSDEVKTLIKDYLAENSPYDRTYLAREEVGAPRGGDQRIDEVSYVGEEVTYETVGAAFLVKCSQFRAWDADDEAPKWGKDPVGFYAVLGRGMDEEYYEVRGVRYDAHSDDIKKMILEVSYGLMDLDAALWRDGYPTPAGPGGGIDFFREAYDGEPEIEILADWEPTYAPGDYWFRQFRDGFSALCYHSAVSGSDTVNTIDTTREDLFTYRGIRVGATRGEVLSAYPDIYDTPYWDGNDLNFPSDDYLWYCRNPEGWGAALLFFFDGDAVSQIRLINMFD